MNGHTSVPWRQEDGVIYGLEMGEEVAIAYATRDPAELDTSDGLTEFDLHNIPRIVACVNACEGIDTETLTTWGVGGCLDAQRILGDTNHALGLRNVDLGHQVQALLRERDAMRALLQRLVMWNHNANGSGIELGEMLVDAEALLEHGPKAIEHKAPSHKDGEPAEAQADPATDVGCTGSQPACGSCRVLCDELGRAQASVSKLQAANSGLQSQVLSLQDQLDQRNQELQRAALQRMARPGDISNLVLQRDGLMRQRDEIQALLQSHLGQFTDDVLLMNADLGGIPSSWLLEFRAAVRDFNSRWAFSGSL
jgi:hypothetical protein